MLTDMNKAKITKIELVDGCMLSFALDLPAGSSAEDFSEAIGDVLNCLTEGSVGLVNSFACETDLKVGDELTDEGGVIECSAAEGEIEHTSLRRRTVDYRDAFAQKMSGEGER